MTEMVVRPATTIVGEESLLVWLYFVLGFFISALVHEMGHVGVGLLQGYREAVIRFGSSSSSFA